MSDMSRLDVIRANNEVGLYNTATDTIAYLLELIDLMGDYIEDQLTPYPDDDAEWLHSQ